MGSILEIDNISLSFSGVKALKGISLEINQGELAAVIGPNGAGKTSLFNCISGVYAPQTGKILFEGEAILGKSPEFLASQGIARTFQNLAMFEYMTTLENLMLGRHNHYKSGFFTDMFNLKGFKKEETKNREKVEHVIDFLGLERYRDFPVGILPYGVLKRIELGRALCMDPKILLLDEPAAGLNQEETEDLARYILDIKEELGITQILIEHELHLVLDLADQIHVFDFGSRIASGVPEKIKNNPAVIKAYLGQEEDF